MNPRQLIPCVLDGTSGLVSQGSHLSGQVIRNVGCGTATGINGIADMSEAATTAVTKTGRNFTNRVGEWIRDAESGAGIVPVSDVAADFINSCGGVTAGAVDMGVSLPIGAAKGTAEIASLLRRRAAMLLWQ